MGFHPQWHGVQVGGVSDRKHGFTKTSNGAALDGFVCGSVEVSQFRRICY